MATTPGCALNHVRQGASATCHVTFPTLPETGKYRMVLATRDGNDPNEFSLARVTRNVTVIHEANA